MSTYSRPARPSITSRADPSGARLSRAAEHGESEMCGIVGLFSKSTAVEERLGEHLGAMLGQMSDRGPDSAGVAVYRDPAPPGASKVSLYSPDPGMDWAPVREGLARAFGGDPQARGGARHAVLVVDAEAGNAPPGRRGHH